MMWKRSILVNGMLLVVAWLFVTIFSYTTSPLYHDAAYSPDSPVFQIIGKYWAEGDVPYQDLWDMKGPFIFLVNALGYLLTDSRLGVYIIQVLFLFLTLTTVYRLFLLRFAKRRSFLLTLFSLSGLSYVYEGGNLTEEYLLFPLTLSFFFLLKWLDGYEQKGNVRHTPMHAIVYGVVLGISMMSRLTNALPVCAAVVVIVIMLLRCREYRNLLFNALFFITGFAVVVLPFVAYFWHHHALSAMWDATFVYALSYAGHTSNDVLASGLHYFVLSYFNSILLMLLMVWRVIRDKRLTVGTCMWFLAAAIPFIWFCQGNGFGHYGMVVYPLYAIAMIELYRQRLTLLRWAVIAVLIVGCASKLWFMRTIYNSQNVEVINCKAFLRQTPEVDYTSFVAYNCDPNLYLHLNVRPAVPVFAMQDMGASRIPHWDSFLTNAFTAHQPQWILVQGQPIIQSLLDERYTLTAHDADTHLKLYHLANRP